MAWLTAGIVYTVAYVAVVSSLGSAHARLVAGNVGLLLAPLSVIAALVRRRGAWVGRQRLFWMAIGAGAVLWLIGQIPWSIDEVFRAQPLPWFKWPIILQLCGSLLPFLALVAWPHRGPRTDSAAAAALDVLLLTVLTAFMYWTLIIAPGMAPGWSTAALRMLAVVGPSVRLAAFVGLLWTAYAAARSPWAAVYQRIASGMGVAFAVLVYMSFSSVEGTYQTGSPADIGWMLPFWFQAWAAATSPASEREAHEQLMASGAGSGHPILLLGAIAIVPLVGYGVRFLMPLGEPFDQYRQHATAGALVAAALVAMVRLEVERRNVQRADSRLRLLAAACEQTEESILIADTQTIEYANDAACRTFGYSRDQLEGKTGVELLAPESRAAGLALGQTLRNGQFIRSNLTFVRQDGTTFEGVSIAAPIFDASNKVTHVVAAIRDQTDDLHVRERIVRAERLSAIGEIVAGVANEISNPLQSVIGTMELLLVGRHERVVRDDLERAHRDAARAVRIIRNLLIFVRKSPKERLLIDMNEVVQATVSLSTHELRAAGVQVREEYAAVLPLVLADREELQQVVLNLIVNAEQALSETNHGSGQLIVRTLAAGSDAVLEVADNGPGVPPEHAGRIFEPFFTTRSIGDGTGLGLPVAFGIATAHGGTLELVPSDTGACFRLTLPGAGFPGPAHAS